MSVDEKKIIKQQMMQIVNKWKHKKDLPLSRRERVKRYEDRKKYVFLKKKLNNIINKKNDIIEIAKRVFEIN